MIKPGYKTSEFWFTLVSFIFSGLYLIGIFGEDAQQKEDLIRDVSHGVESVILISGQIMLLMKYLNGRKSIKETWWNTATPEERTEVINKTKTTAKPVKKTPKKQPIKKTKN
jgi:hypothetical protein